MRADDVGDCPVLIVGDVHGLRGVVVQLPHYARVADRAVGLDSHDAGVVLDGHFIALLQAVGLGRRLAVDGDDILLGEGELHHLRLCPVPIVMLNSRLAAS